MNNLICANQLNTFHVPSILLHLNLAFVVKNIEVNFMFSFVFPIFVTGIHLMAIKFAHCYEIL